MYVDLRKQEVEEDVWGEVGGGGGKWVGREPEEGGEKFIKKKKHK